MVKVKVYLGFKTRRARYSCVSNMQIFSEEFFFATTLVYTGSGRIFIFLGDSSLSSTTFEYVPTTGNNSPCMFLLCVFFGHFGQQSSVYQTVHCSSKKTFSGLKRCSLENCLITIFFSVVGIVFSWSWTSDPTILRAKCMSNPVLVNRGGRDPPLMA